MNENISYNVLTEGTQSTVSFSGEQVVGSTFNVNSYYSVFVNVLNPVAELEFPYGTNVKIQLNKKLNWFQRLCYNLLGFKYRTL